MLRASIMNSLCRLHENAGGFLFLPFLPSFHWMPPQSLLISIVSVAILVYIFFVGDLSAILFPKFIIPKNDN